MKSGHIQLFWFAAIFLLAGCVRVDAKSSFLPFSSNQWGTNTNSPSFAPASVSSSERERKRVKKRRKSSKGQELLPTNNGENDGPDTKHVGKKKRRVKRKSNALDKQSNSMAFINTEIQGQKRHSRKKKMKKKSITTTVPKGTPSRAASTGLSSSSKKKGVQRKASKLSIGKSRDRESGESGIVKKSKKRRKVGRDQSNSNENKRRIEGKVSGKKKKSKKRKTRSEEPSSPTILPDIGTRSAEVKASKTKKRVKKARRRVAKPTSIIEESVTSDPISASLSSGEPGVDVDAPSTTSLEETSSQFDSSRSMSTDSAIENEVEDIEGSETMPEILDGKPDGENTKGEDDTEQAANEINLVTSSIEEPNDTKRSVATDETDSIVDENNEPVCEENSVAEVETGGSTNDASTELNKQESTVDFNPIVADYEPEKDIPIRNEETNENNETMNSLQGKETVEDISSEVSETNEEAIENYGPTLLDHTGAEDEPLGSVIEAAALKLDNDDSVSLQNEDSIESSSEVSETNDELMDQYKPGLLEQSHENYSESKDNSSDTEKSLEEPKSAINESLDDDDATSTSNNSPTEIETGNELVQTTYEESQHATEASHMDSIEIPSTKEETTRESGADQEEIKEVQNQNFENDSSSVEVNLGEDQDVLEFIEDLLQEDVRSWVNDTSSETELSASDTLNDTRGGHSETFDDDGDDDEKEDDNAKLPLVKEENQPVDEVGDGAGSHDDESNTAQQPPITNDPAVEEDKSSHDDNAETQAEGDPEEEKSTKDDNVEAQKEEKDAEVPEQEEKITKPKLDLSTLESSEDADSDMVVSVVSWNLAEESPSEDDAAFIRKFRKAGVKPGTGSDLVLISGQECENIKPRRSEGRRSREYRRLMIKMLGRQYVPIAMHLLGGIQFGLFAKKSFLKEIEHVSVADVTCGIGNVFHNKGAIAAFVQVKARNPTEGNKAKSLKMIFVTAHLAAHVKNSDARDSDFWRISSELESQAPEGFLPRKLSDEDTTTKSFLFSNVDRVFFCGDLNYRVDLPRELTEHTIRNEDSTACEELMRHDQLKRTIAEGRAFTGFAEGKIAFAPTFKFDKETGSYDTSHKQRIPAWTDRILFKPDGTRVLEYTSVPDAQHSDHRPVHGTFRVNMEGRDIPARKRTRKKKQQRSKRDRSDY